ncbi:MAG TPA: hypothetical protein PLX35_11405 [Cyclobacteriaceae bacterium]|nr:hypothetical protein [Cyclobacteriaceae bacterium]
MSSPKTLVFPFSLEDSYFESYAWAVELALRINARLLPFTTASSAEASQQVYHSLLAAHGYYLQHYPATVQRDLSAFREPMIASGDMVVELTAFLRSHPTDILILDAVFAKAHAVKIQQIVRESAGAIVLPADDPEKSVATVDHFYDLLRRARLYKLPNNFFSSLARDRGAFNYLRRFFQQKAG